jgi:alpha-glucosidase (family GH31 glycosyl hydrolase)
MKKTITISQLAKKINSIISNAAVLVENFFLLINSTVKLVLEAVYNVFNGIANGKNWRISIIAIIIFGGFEFSDAKAVFNVGEESPIKSAKKINNTTIEVLYTNGKKMLIDFYGENIFRLFQDNSGGAIRSPQAKPEAQILADNPRRTVSKLEINNGNSQIVIATTNTVIYLDKHTQLFKVVNTSKNTIAFEFVKPLLFESNKLSIVLKENIDEYFYGGGVQNGRFSHKGKVISIENQNSWTDGGVASPTPFFWSTKGYGMMWHTFKKGKYDFGAKEKGLVNLYHETDYLDVFFMIADGATPLLNSFYQLTGNPVLLPKFGFYQGHLNAYNRDYWLTDEKGILFEDGKRYKESQKNNGGIKESLNGEKDNYQFSARAVIDRYKNNDMPLGWILPNDGYGAGYGQTSTLDSNIANLKSFGDYARKNGVEIGLWTQSDLHPKENISPLLQRDIIKEVRDAGVRVLKTDVAWVGAGYSFGLNGVADVGQIMPKYGNNARPFIISLDGWAGTQRYAGIWSGDQTGGQWEYIRFHIPTYLGSGLSGQPNISSDMDGIFGGKNPIVNTRDFQWKTFTPMQLNMDGWGSNEKYPQALGEPITSINRNYLKLKSELMPYAYSIAKDAVNGLPMIRAMFLVNPNAYTYGVATQYQFLYGPNFLIAPIYQSTKSDEKGNDIRNGIYLPQGSWIDYFTGDVYEGNRVINDFDAPIWKLPVFVKAGAIIPLNNPNNNPSQVNYKQRIFELYPSGKSEFTLYDDDGTTEAYKNGIGTSTTIESVVDNQNALITIHPTKGTFSGFEKMQSTTFKVNVTIKPKSFAVTIGKKTRVLKEVKSYDEFLKSNDVYFYDEAPNMNKFATKGVDFERVVMKKNPQLLVKLAATDITTNKIVLNIKGYRFEPVNRLLNTAGKLMPPLSVKITKDNIGPYTLMPTWDKVVNADFYEIKFDDILYTTIKQNNLLFDGLKPETNYQFHIRAVNKDQKSEWVTFSAKTKNDPLEFAINGIIAETSVLNQGGNEINKLFDFDEGNLWHTKWATTAVPFNMIIDLKTVNQLEKIQYLPRNGRGNGMIQEGVAYYSSDKQNWTKAADFIWANDDKVKVLTFTEKPAARYIKLDVTKATGNFGSGREMYVFKVPETESYLQGDINNDKRLDRNDLISYTNYTGLRKGDSDFEGYISNGDINKNDLIDAYDISVAATQIEGVAKAKRDDKLQGRLSLITAKQNYAKGDIVEIQVKGEGLSAVNALSFALPYNEQDYEYVSVLPLAVENAENFTYDRLHTDRKKALYPTFVNVGNQATIKGSNILFLIKLKAKRNLKFNLKASEGLLVDKDLNVIRF